MGQSKPACPKLLSLLPEWLFRRKKTLSKSQPRKPAIAREAGQRPRRIAKPRPRGAATAGAKSCRVVARGTFPGARPVLRPRDPGPAPWAARPCLGTEKDTTGVVPGHQFAKGSLMWPLGAFVGRVLEPRSGGGVGSLGEWSGAALCLSTRPRGQDRGQGVCRNWGWGPQCADTRGEGEPVTAFPTKGPSSARAPPPLLVPPLQLPTHHRTPWLSPEPHESCHRTSPVRPGQNRDRFLGQRI